jgi:hypothetical protein
MSTFLPSVNSHKFDKNPKKLNSSLLKDKYKLSFVDFDL